MFGVRLMSSAVLVVLALVGCSDDGANAGQTQPEQTGAYTVAWQSVDDVDNLTLLLDEASAIEEFSDYTVQVPAFADPGDSKGMQMLNEKLEEYKDEPEPLELGKQEVRRIFEESGVSDDLLEEFDCHYDERAGEKTSFLAANVASTKSFQIETPDVVIRVKPEAAGMVETRVIDGRQCIVIAVSDKVEVNGVGIHCK